MSARKKFQLKAQNKELAVDPYMPPRRKGMHNEVEYRFLIKSIRLNKQLYKALRV